MFFPYSVDNPKKRFPYATVALIAVNVLLFLFLGFDSGYQEIVLKYGAMPERHRYYDLFTHIYLHGSLGHVLGNMWFLWLFGSNMEDQMGVPLYLLFYHAGGVTAALVFTALSGASGVPMIGASGAIFAVMCGYMILFHDALVNVWYFFWFYIKIYEGTWKIRALWFIGFYFVINVYNTYIIMANNWSGFGVAYGAHVGGGIFGMAVALGLKGLGIIKIEKTVKQKIEELDRIEEQKQRVEKYQKGIKEKLQYRDYEAAANEFMQALHKNAYDLLDFPALDWWNMAESLRKRRHYAEALTAYKNYTRESSNAAEGAAAYLPMALVFEAQGDLEKAQGHLQFFLQRRPEDPNAQFARDSLKRISALNPPPPKPSPPAAEDAKAGDMPQYCDYCGRQIAPGKKFCTGCGRALVTT